MKFVSLASGSSGNATFISYADKKLLIDCGISLKLLKNRFKEIEENIEDLDYIFITHSHDDHVKSLSNIMSVTKAKVLSREQILNEIIDKYTKEKNLFDTNRFYPIPEDINNININDDFNIQIHNAFHDVRCVYYKIICGNDKLAILTDNGHYDDNIINTIMDVNYLMLECNYDYEMLMNYPYYPQFLKNRIAGDNGHLSNEDCCKIIKTINNENLKIVCLSHISEHSNTEELALKYVKQYFKKYKNINLPKILTASKNNITNII